MNRPLSHFTCRAVCLFAAMSLFLVLSPSCSKDPPKEKPECTDNTDCKSGYFCDPKNKKCKKLACESDAECNNNEECKNGQCVLKPTPEPTPDGPPPDGGPTEKPVDPCKGATTCKVNTDCTGKNETCVDGCCIGTCDPTTPCPGNLHCKVDTSECVECLTDDHCGTNSALCPTDGDCNTAKVKRCVSNKCMEAACECPLGQKCNQTSGKCEFEKKCPGGVQPDPNGKCPKPCPNANCPADETPDPDDSCKCIKRIGWCRTCTRDPECGLNGRCVSDAQGNKFCAEDCTETSKCTEASAYQCLNLGKYKVCMPISGNCPCLGVTCPAGQKCCNHDSGCHECCEKGDCQAPKICHNVTFTCVEDKCAGVSCPTGQKCNPQTGTCGANCPSQCPSGTCCDTSTGQCTAAACGTTGCNPPCTGGNQCCDVMGQKQCMPQCPSGGSCKTDADCKSQGPNYICCDLMGMMKSCMDGSDPLMKMLCGGGSTGGSCKSDADCKDPAKPKCCAGLLPMLPKSCKAKCGGLPFP